MPIYEYTCQACEAHTEHLQKIDDPPLIACPSCGRPELKRLLSPAGFRLKGGGWYETDFKKDKQRNLARDQAAGSEAPSAAEKTEKSDSKPAASNGGTASPADKAAKPTPAKAAAETIAVKEK